MEKENQPVPLIPQLWPPGEPALAGHSHSALHDLSGLLELCLSHGHSTAALAGSLGETHKE